MTLSVLVFRHGKSDWSADYVHDADRPLNRRGRKAAKVMGRFLTANDVEPDLAITSPARRARDTLEVARRAGGWSSRIRTSEWLYGNGPVEVMLLLRTGVPDWVDRVMIVGHEPTSSDMIELLTGARVRFPTAAVASVELDVTSWGTVSAGTGRLAWLVPPRLLGAARFRPGKTPRRADSQLLGPDLQAGMESEPR